MNHLNDKFFHLGTAPDRDFRPVENHEITKLASHVLDKICTAGPSRNSLLRRIGEPY